MGDAEWLRTTGNPSETAALHAQYARCQKLFCAIVLATLDEAIADDRRFKNGSGSIASWARSRDGRTVLSCAGIDPSERAVAGLVAFVQRGVKTTIALADNQKVSDEDDSY